jgi:hypothetical protein
MDIETECRQASLNFKRCPTCGHMWASRDRLLADPDITVVGYQASFKKLTEGLFLFNHLCNATLALPAEKFIDLYNGPIFEERLTGGKTCPGHCLYQNDLSSCPAKCDCAFVREILQIIRKWPKNDKPSAAFNG